MKKLIPLLILSLCLCIILCACFAKAGTDDDLSDPTEASTPEDSETPEDKPSEKPEEPGIPETPEKPSQEKLLDDIYASLWTDGEIYYEFHENGSVDKISIDPIEYSVNISPAAFTWKISDDLLYFSSDDTDYLLAISVDPKESISSSVTPALARSDLSLMSVNVISHRNISNKKTLAFVNGKFVYESEYKFYLDETATVPLLSDSDLSGKQIYAYPDDIKRIHITCHETDFDVYLHNYISDDYILKSGLSLPTPPKDSVWTYDDSEYNTVYDIMDMIDALTIDADINIEMQAMPIVHENEISGKYRYTNSLGETFYIIVTETDDSRGKFAICDANETEFCFFTWRKDQDEYLFEENDFGDAAVGSFTQKDDGNILLKSSDAKREIEQAIGDITLIKI